MYETYPAIAPTTQDRLIGVLGYFMAKVRVMQIIIAKNIDSFAVNEITDDHAVQNASFAKSILRRLLRRETTRGKIDETVRKSTTVIARYRRS